MTFTAGIPASGQSLGQTRDTIRNNFSNYNTLVSVDHVAPNAAGQGQHQQVTFNTFGNVNNYTQTGTQSYLYSNNASNAGTSLVYQPSIVSKGTIVPVTVRAICRVVWGGATWTLSANGPYGANSTFNVGSITSVNKSNFTVNFSQPLATTDYFVYAATENANQQVSVTDTESKLVGSFAMHLSSTVGIPVGATVIIMVF